MHTCMHDAWLTILYVDYFPVLVSYNLGCLSSVLLTAVTPTPSSTGAPQQHEAKSVLGTAIPRIPQEPAGHRILS